MMNRMCLAACAAAATGCTTLGPMPAMTGTTPMPASRTSVELQVAAVPGHYLSSSVAEEPNGSGILQAAALIDLGHVTLPGLIVGGRYVGKSSQGGYPEPMLGYRAFLGRDHRLGIAAVGFGTHASGDNEGASYEATRVGLELGIDARLTPPSRAVELHAIAGGAATGVWGEGTYCQDPDGPFAVDCGETPMEVAAEASGLYPSGHLGLAVDALRNRNFFHGARVALDIAGGMMPRIVDAEQVDAERYVSLGLSFTIGFGARE